MRRCSRSSAAALAACALAGCAALAPRGAADAPLVDLLGRPVSLADLLGRGPALLAFWATWCVPCDAEMAHLERLHAEYAPRGVGVVAVSVDGPDTAAAVEPWVRRRKLTLPVLRDPGTELLSRFHPQGTLPYWVLLEPSGAVRAQHAGYVPGDEREMERALEGALAAGGPRVAVYETLRAEARSGAAAWATDVLEAGASWGEWSARARLDAAAFAGAPPCPGAQGSGPWGLLDARLEKWQLRWDARELRAAAGDLYAQSGNGLLLSLRKVDALARDTTLLGGAAATRAGKVALQAAAGLVNARNLDPIAGCFRYDPGDLVGAARAALDGPAEVGAHYVVVRPDPARGGLAQAAGVSAAARGLFDGRLTVGGEADAIARESAGRLFTSWGAYGYAHAVLEPWTALLEVKAYRDFGLGDSTGAEPYGEPPSLERDDQPVPDNRDAAGARIRLERTLDETLTLAANVLVYGFDRLRPALAMHAYLAAEWRPRPGAVFKASAGRRREEDRAPLAPRYEVWHLDGSAVSPVYGAHGLIVQGEAKAVRKPLVGEWTELRLGAGWSWAPRLSLTALYAFTDEFPRRPPHHFALEATWRPGPAHEVSLLVGSMPGGLVCVNGNCRALPPFSGVRIEATLRL